MSRANEPVYPQDASVQVPRDERGLTIREYYVGLAMQGLLAAHHSAQTYLWNGQNITLEEMAVNRADRLLAELAKPVTQAASVAARDLLDALRLVELDCTRPDIKTDDERILYILGNVRAVLAKVAP